MTGNTVQILAGDTFIVTDDRGDVHPSPSSPSGLFSVDTRFLSTWVLTVDGEPLTPLSVDDLHYFESRFFLVPGTATHYVDAKLSVIREQMVGNNFTEQVTIINHFDQPVEISVRLEVASDFADIFEIKDVTKKKGNYYTEIEDSRLRLGYERNTYRRETIVATSAPGQIDPHGFTYTLHLDPNESWVTQLDVDTRAPGPHGRDLRMALKDHGQAQPELREDLRNWIDAAPRVSCDCQPLDSTYRRSLVDLAALRFSPMTLRGESLPAAGLPWFMTLFGRDSIFTSLQALPFAPQLAATTLRILATLQGSRVDDFRDEDPGKILHEMRYGETAAFEEQPHSPYYGTADATPLFVVLLDEYERWSGDLALVKQLEPQARAALNWIDEYGDLMGNGYLAYQRRNEQTGLENQCWKDSWDAISYRDGRLPMFPRATCELQGYAYDAKIRAARLARLAWNDPAYADRLEAEAAALKERFNRDYWIEEGGYYALALAGDGTRVDSLSSNIGHLLWSDIVPPDRAARVAAHLLGPRLFSGWGVRTLAVGETRYNPIGYHVGTVWPFDNSFIAWGLRRQGFKEEAATIADGMIDAAGYFDGRLPEAFGGYDRSLTKYPVQYPTACSPQAWSTGTPLLLLRTMLGLEPYGDHLIVDPAMPKSIGRLELLDIPGRWGLADAFARGRIEVRNLEEIRSAHEHAP
jgi:glycogen debranching enzyme